MRSLSGATGLLVGAISYALGVCALAAPGEMALPTPCAEWDLGMLLAHLARSMADLETVIRTGDLDLDHPENPPDPGTGDPVELIRERAAELLCAVYCSGVPGTPGTPESSGRFVTVGDLPMPAGLVACTGAMEIAVHGWDVSAARSRAGRGGVRPIPAALASRMLELCPLLVAGREGLFAVPVAVPAQASPGDRLIGYLGRAPLSPGGRL